MFRAVSYNIPQYSSRTTHHLYSSFLETHNVRIGCTHRWDITMRWCDIAAVTIGFENLMFRTVSYNTPQYSSRTTHHLFSSFLETHNVRIGCTHRWDITMRWCDIAAVTIGFENLMFRTVSYNTPQYSSRTTHHLYSSFLETHNVRIGCTYRWDITMRWCDIAAVTIGPTDTYIQYEHCVFLRRGSKDGGSYGWNIGVCCTTRFGTQDSQILL